MVRCNVKKLDEILLGCSGFLEVPKYRVLRGKVPASLVIARLQQHRNHENQESITRVVEL